jgi:hypothetical protein
MLRKLRALIILAGFCAACGGSPPTGGVDICAMNPIATSCQIESVQGAVANGFRTGSRPYVIGEFECGGSMYRLGASLDTEFQYPAWWTAFRYITWANPNWGGYTTESLVAGFMQMQTATDGPWHVLYNTQPITGYFATNPDAIGGKFATIPAYGIWIYAPGERADYPNGAEVVTLDLFQGCNKRVQFVVAL